MPLISIMRSRAILLVSLGANLVLATGWFWTAQLYARRFSRAGIVTDTGVAPLIKTNFLVRQQFFTWQEVESDDYPAYIANLRDISCPEQTIRDIIIGGCPGGNILEYLPSTGKIKAYTTAAAATEVANAVDMTANTFSVLVIGTP